MKFHEIFGQVLNRETIARCFLHTLQIFRYDQSRSVTGSPYSN